MYGEHGAGRQDADPAARPTAGDRLQARALSRHPAVRSDRRDAGEPRGAASGLVGAAAAEHLFRRAPAPGPLSRLLGARDALPGEGVIAAGLRERSHSIAAARRRLAIIE